MRIYKCIIVEDEPLAVEILREYILEIPFLSLEEVCSDAMSALQVLQQQEIDLIFLDIHLPRLKGLEFLRTLKHPPNVIITTAYHQYALESYEHNIIDYLMKPIEFSRFLKAVNKIRETERVEIQPLLLNQKRPYIFCTVNKKRVKIFNDEILYIESQKEYSKLVTSSKTIITKLQSAQIEAFLSSGNCIRVHRSFIVAINKIESYSATEIEIASFQFPIGRSYKELVQQVLDEMSR